MYGLVFWTKTVLFKSKMGVNRNSMHLYLLPYLLKLIQDKLITHPKFYICLRNSNILCSFLFVCFFNYTCRTSQWPGVERLHWDQLVNWVLVLIMTFRSWQNPVWKSISWGWSYIQICEPTSRVDCFFFLSIR